MVAVSTKNATGFLRLTSTVVHIQWRAVVDSGASIHLCPSWYLLSPMQPKDTLSLRSAGGDVVAYLVCNTEKLRV